MPKSVSKGPAARKYRNFTVCFMYHFRSFSTLALLPEWLRGHVKAVMYIYARGFESHGVHIFFCLVAGRVHRTLVRGGGGGARWVATLGVWPLNRGGSPMHAHQLLCMFIQPTYNVILDYSILQRLRAE